jgi:hypothetical protein
MNKRYYAIHPGFIESATDNDLHFIGFLDLVRLYQVDPKECIVWDEPRELENPQQHWKGFDPQKYIHLYPQFSGKEYSIEGRNKGEGYGVYIKEVCYDL